MTNRLEVVGERVVDDAEVAKVQQDRDRQMAEIQKQRDAATAMLMTGIRALSQKFVVAVAHFFTLMTVASAFYLWAIALPNITTQQIIALSIYSVFILGVNIWGKRS